MLFTAISQLQGPSSAREPFNPHRPTSPEETRGHWVMFRKIIRATFSGDCEASKDIFKDIYRCSLVSCQAAGINSHSRLILRSIIQGADVRNWSGGDPVLTSAVLEHLLPPAARRKTHFVLHWDNQLALSRLKRGPYGNVKDFNANTQRQALQGWCVGGYCAYRRQQLRSICLFMFSFHFSLSEGGAITAGCLRVRKR